MASLQQPQQAQQGQRRLSRTHAHSHGPEPTMTDTTPGPPVHKTSWWQWIVFWVMNKLHAGFPIMNWIFGYSPLWAPDQMEDKTGQVILITGANSGTGYETAKAYYERGAKVYVACRSEKRASEAITEIKAGASRDVAGVLHVPTTPPVTTGAGTLEFVYLDLADLDTVDAAVKFVLEREDRLDVLFANAGIMATDPGFTAQGYVLQFGTNVVGHQRLISRLLPILRSTSIANPASPARLITSSSIAHELAPRGNHEDGGIAYDTLTRDSPRQLNRWQEYGESKWGDIALARYVNAHHGPGKDADAEILAFSVHPGPVSSNLGNHIGLYGFIRAARFMLEAFQITPYQGALNQLWLANLPVSEARRYVGAYVSIFQEVIPARPDLDYPQAWEKLWNWCEAQAVPAF